MLRAKLRSHIFGTRVRSSLTTRCPQHDQIFPREFLNAQHRKVRRLDLIAVLQKFPLDLVQLVVGDTDRRKDRLTVFIAVLPDHDVTAAEILKVIGERAQRADDGIGIPAGLVFDPVLFNSALPEQILQVDRELADFGFLPLFGRLGFHATTSAGETGTAWTTNPSSMHGGR